MESTKDLLAPALRQYQHNDSSGFIFGYDKTEITEIVDDLRTQLAKANDRVKELEEELATKELLHVGFTKGSQIKYAKVEEGSFYPNTDGNCYIPLYMLKSHEHRIETTSIEQLRKEQE